MVLPLLGIWIFRTARLDSACSSQHTASSNATPHPSLQGLVLALPSSPNSTHSSFCQSPSSIYTASNIPNLTSSPSYHPLSQPVFSSPITTTCVMATSYSPDITSTYSPKKAAISPLYPHQILHRLLRPALQHRTRPHLFFSTNMSLAHRLS